MFAIVFFVFSCADVNSKSRQVSIAQLINSPKEYFGDRVFFYGYGRELGGVYYVYLTREDALLFNQASAVPVASAEEKILIQCNDSYVKVIGEYGGIEGLELPGVVKIELISKYEDLEKQPLLSEKCWP